MKVVAKTRYLRVSAQKLRLSADMIRGNRVDDAMNNLRMASHKTDGFVYDTLKSAMANAENNYNLNPSTLVVSEIRVDQGPNLKRVRPRSRGMANQILHPMSHLTIVLDEPKLDKPTKPKTATKTSAKAAVKPASTKEKK